MNGTIIWKHEDFIGKWFKGVDHFGVKDNNFLMYIHSYNPQTGLFVADGEEHFEREITRSGIVGIISGENIDFENLRPNLTATTKSDLFKKTTYSGRISVEKGFIMMEGRFIYKTSSSGLILKAQLPYKP